MDHLQIGRAPINDAKGIAMVNVHTHQTTSMGSISDSLPQGLIVEQEVSLGLIRF